MVVLRLWIAPTKSAVPSPDTEYEGVVTQMPPPSADPRRGLDPVSDRRLAEILSAICAHWEALQSDYARQAFLEQLWAAGGPSLRAQGSRASSRGSDGR